MNYLKNEFQIGDRDGTEDPTLSIHHLEAKLLDIQSALETLPKEATTTERLKLTLDSCYLLLDLERKEEAWSIAKDSFDKALAEQLWTQAVEACDVMYQADLDNSISALAHGIWLGVTFPIEPELSVAMLQHLVDETQEKDDGAAVAAATACYLVDLRAEGKQLEELRFFTRQLLGQVAKRHSQVDDPEIFDFWVERLELDNPDKFLPRLASILNVLTIDDWWYDRDQLRDLIPA
jgi:hypothetical protein